MPLSRSAARVLRARINVTRLSSLSLVRTRCSNSNSPGTPLTGPIPSELGTFFALTQLCGPPARGAFGRARSAARLAADRRAAPVRAGSWATTSSAGQSRRVSGCSRGSSCCTSAGSPARGSSPSPSLGGRWHGHLTRRSAARLLAPRSEQAPLRQWAGWRAPLRAGALDGAHHWVRRALSHTIAAHGRRGEVSSASPPGAASHPARRARRRLDGNGIGCTIPTELGRLTQISAMCARRPTSDRASVLALQRACEAAVHEARRGARDLR